MVVSGRRRERKLPVKQLTILAICRFAEPLATTSLFPYLPEMVESFGIPQNEVGKWAGLLAAAFSICQALMGIPWGRFSDYYGRKLSILLGLTCTLCTSLLLGLSVNIPMAMVARAIAGAGNGNVGILRTTVAEMVPFKELQPRAFSIMPLVWTIGSIFGPTVGGALANPFNVSPGDGKPRDNLFKKFPYLLPNLVSAIFFAIGITVGFLFLEETLESRRQSRDIGLTLGRKIVSVVRPPSLKLASLLHLRKKSSSETTSETDPRNLPDDETAPLLKTSTPPDEETAKPSPSLPPPTFREVLNPQSLINLLAYTILALHSIAYDQVLPVYMQHDPIGSPDSTPFHPPLSFAGGLGLDHFSIGLMSTAYGIAGVFVQFLVFPPLCRRYGVLFWFKAVSCAFPLVYLVTPFTVLLPTNAWRLAALLGVMFVKSWCVIFAFPCSVILLTNSAHSLRVLGTLNGFATTCSAIGRATGPAVGGALFTLGMKRGYLIAPFWFIAGVGVLGAVVVFFIEEGEGFEASDGEEEEGEEEEENAGQQRSEDALIQSAVDGDAQAAGRPGGPNLGPTIRSNEGEQTYGSIRPVASAVESDDEDAGGLLGPSPRRVTSRKASREMSAPIGMKNSGVGRKYSSNLGQSLASPGSFHE